MVKITDPERAGSLRETLLALLATGGEATELVGSASGERRCRCCPGARVAGAAEGGGAAPLLEKGERLFRQGDMAGAIAAFDEAAKVDPEGRAAALLEGRRAGEEGGRRRRGRRLQGRRSRARPTSPRRTTTWARCCCAKDDRPGAAGELEAAVQAKPAYAEAQYNLGVARDALGKKQEAVVAYREAVRLKPRDAGLPPEPGRGAAAQPAT